MEKGSGAEGREPFGSPLVESAELSSERLRKLEDNPEVVIRLVHEFVGTPEKLATSRKVYEELAEFGVNIPKYNHVIAEGPEQTGAYVVTEKIHGTDMLTKLAEKDRDFLASEAEPLYRGLIGYYQKKYESGGNYALDMHNRQFMYGSTAKNPMEKLYLIDIDPVFMNFDKSDADPMMQTRFAGRVSEVANMIIEAEEISGEELTNAREDIGSLLDTLGEGSELMSQYAGEIKQGLSEGEQLDWSEWMDRLFPDD